jgi:streptogramin lyase
MLGTKRMTVHVAFDGSGNLWFTTPNNSMIGEFSPSAGKFVGQWPVTAGSGPLGSHLRECGVRVLERAS